MNDIRDITHRTDYSSPMRLIGAILAQGVIRLHTRQRSENLARTAAVPMDPTINLEPPRGTAGPERQELEPVGSNSKQGFEP